MDDIGSSSTISNNWRPVEYDMRTMMSVPSSHSSSQQADQDICTQRDPPLSQLPDIDDIMDVQHTEAPAVPKPWARLICKSTDLPSYDLTSIPPDDSNRFNLYLIGRNAQCNPRIDTSPRISNKHCMIYCQENKADKNSIYLEAWIEDLSANGTYMNKETKLQKNVPRLLRSGDEIHLINPALVHMAGSRVTATDLERNTYVVIVDLPQPQHISTTRTLRSQTLTRGLQAAIGRSNTVVRLLDQNRPLSDHYVLGQILGQGTSGAVFLGINKATGREWAVKSIDVRRLMYSGGLEEVTKEAEMLRSLRHPNIIHLEDIFADHDKIYLVMELSKGGDLFDRISLRKRYSEDKAKRVMHQILQALSYLHDRKVAHRDLKPENILLVSKDDDVSLKLSDFGLAKVQDEQTGGLKSFCGTPQYFAPEVLQRKRTVLGQGRYTLQADMWSVGVILYVLLAGQYPFNEQNLDVQISTASFSLTGKLWQGVSAKAKDLVAQLLVVDPHRRLTARGALLHAWFSDLREEREEEERESMPPPASLPLSAQKEERGGGEESETGGERGEVKSSSRGGKRGQKRGRG